LQLDKLLKKIRGNDARAAYRAIAQLRFPHDASVADAVAAYKPKDAQRRFQFELAGIVLREGTAGLARRWFTLGTAEQRHHLLGEIEQFLNEWASEGIVELAITALDEPDDKLRGYALLCVRTAVTFDGTRKFITPERRARIAQALVRAMARHDERPLDLFWLEKHVELLGLVGDESVVERLERLRPFAGASRRTRVEKLDADNLPYPYPKDPKDWPPGLPKPVARVWDVGTGLLEIRTLEKALERIRARKL
jgi:hypothetical protein